MKNSAQKFTAIGSSPDGININQNCGSTSPEFLKEEIAKGEYDLGIAFDGDGDRILIVIFRTEIFLMEMIFFIFFLKILEVEGSGVIGTLMTNKALEIHFEENSNMNFSSTDVGDKYVLTGTC